MKSFESLRFLVVGALNTIVGFSIYFLCLKYLDLHYILSLLIAHIIGVAHSYVWNNKWTFKVAKTETTSFLKFITVYVITFILNLVLLSILIAFMNQLTSQAVALMITTMISYAGHKFWSFRIKETER